MADQTPGYVDPGGPSSSRAKSAPISACRNFAHMQKRLAGYLAMLFFATSGAAHAQVLVAEDDIFEVPHGQTLVVEAFGVLENDVLNDESAGENGATADWVSGPSHGALSLSLDGSFTYSPGASFKGIFLAYFADWISQRQYYRFPCH